MKNKHLLFAATLLIILPSWGAVGDTFSTDDLSFTVISESPARVQITGPVDASSLSGELIIPSTVTNNETEYAVTQIRGAAFQYCDGITSAYVPASITNFPSNTFYRCANLTEIRIDENNKNYKSVDGVAYNANMTQILNCPGARSGEFVIPESVTQIAGDCFNGCTKLTAVTIPDGVTSIGSVAFFLCKSLTTINIPVSAKFVSDTSSPFGRCSSLKSITVDENNPYYCSSDGVLYTKDMTTLIQYPVALDTEVVIPESVTTISNFSFSECDALTSVEISDKLTNIGNGAFCYCPNLKSFSVAESNPEYSSVNGVLFNKSQTSIISYPNALTGEYTIPATVTELLANTFRGCNLSTVIVPSTVTGMSGNTTFQDCKNLTKLILFSPTPLQFSTFTVHGTPDDMVVYVPKGSLESYEEAWPFVHNFKEIDGFIVILSSTNEEMTVGATIELKANIVSDDDAAVTIKTESWSSSNPAVATVDQSGKVTAVAEGMATITVTVIDENDVSSTDDCTVIVTAASGIEETAADNRYEIDYTQPYEIYDLSGKKIATSLKNLPKGIYIINQNNKSTKIAIN